MYQLFESALGLHAPWFIESIAFDEAARRLDIRIDFHRGSSFPYRNEQEEIDGVFKAYDTLEKTWRHLNFFEHECYLHARVPRVDTPVGKRLVTPPWAGISKGFTLLFEALLVSMAMQMPVRAVARLTRVSDSKLWNLLEHYVNSAREQVDMSQVRSVGLDETSIKRRHSYMTSFVDLDQRRLLFITETRASAVVKRFAEDLEAHGGSVEQITQVSSDMSGVFIKGIGEHLPQAQITFDRFHLMQQLGRAVDDVRRQEARNEPLLKKTRYLFLSNRQRLTPQHRERLAALEAPSLRLKTVRALHLREAFQAIYHAESIEEFTSLLASWYSWAIRSRLEPMRKVARMVKEHWEGIIAWKHSGLNNGLLEGFNSLIQAAKRKARGYRTAKTFSTIAYLLAARLDFRCVNPLMLPT